jgi:tetratricopeptide (TPR) repeat protein
VIGTVLNERYRPDAELGRGGMGVVYRAHDLLLERDVAVKVLSATSLDDEGRSRLLREARSAAGLNHPNIVAVHDAGQAEGIPFIVMELVEGTSLREQQPESLDETLSITGQVCAALEHAHAHGIVHRDLKPENVLIAPDGTAKLNDFGLARSMSSRLTSDGTLVGTVFYLAPELALGQEFDGRADLYALGVMLYELVTGGLPFMAGDPLAVISQHLHAPVVPPRARNPGIPAVLDALIVRLLSKVPQDRPASAGEVRETVERLRAGEPEPEVAAEAAPELSMLDRIVRGRLVAREQELAEARTLWRKATKGEGQVLLVSGEPGIGKTRLVRELMTQVRVSGAWALLGECYAEGGAPYAPFAQVLRETLQNGAGERLDLPAFVLADLLAVAPALRMRFPDVPPNPPLDAESEQQRLFENMVTFCAALCERAPLLLVLEDAHWADSGSLALLRHLARRMRRQRVLIVATYREVELDETRPFQEVLLDLNRERLASRLRLSRLDREGTHDMLSALFAEKITPDFLDGIYRETEGNPFFVEEVCKALVESGGLYFADGRWHRPPNMEELAIPQSIRVAVQSRLGKLPLTVQETLRLAAILGHQFGFDTLAGASELDEEALIEALEAAERAQLIQEVRGPREVTFTFAHALIPTTLAEGIPTLRRRRLHRRAAAAIERLRPDDLEALAYHYGEGGDEERALAYHSRAGDRASAAYANVEAGLHFQAALDLVQAEAERAHLLSKLGIVQARQGRCWEAIEVWREGIGLYARLGDRDGVARLYARTARAAWDGGDTPRGLAICRDGLAAVAGAPDSPDIADLIHETARACYFNGLPEEAASLCRQALQMAERLGAVKVQAEVLTTLGILPGQPVDQALSALTRAAELAESEGLLRQASRAYHNLGSLLANNLGDLHAARDHFLRAVELDRQRGSVAEELFSAALAAYVALLQGDLAAAEKQLLAQRQLQDAVPSPGPASLSMQGTEALLLRYRGQVPEAIEQLRAVQAEARAVGDLQILSAAAEELVEVLLEVGEEQEGQAAALEAITLGERGMMGGIRVRCDLSMHYCRRGEIQAARDLISEARHEITRSNAPSFERNLFWAEAHLAVAERRWPEAMAAFRASTDECARMGMSWYHARTLMDWAEAHRTRAEPGDRDRARDLLRSALGKFEAMGAAYYAAQVMRRLQELEAEG